uniref:Immunoglobulin V-set domain-containing protein n=1 Tax=Monopterus albus TaxID=43700 RepID=A0A3Q3QFT8_MONAL
HAVCLLYVLCITLQNKGRAMTFESAAVTVWSVLFPSALQAHHVHEDKFTKDQLHLHMFSKLHVSLLVDEYVKPRLASGKAPQALGKSFSLKTVHPRITTSEESETFVLHITKARLSDTAFYFCINKQQQSSIFLKGTALRVEGKFKQTAKLDVTADPSPAPCHPGDSVTLQCSLLSDSENKTCSEENSVCCFRAGSHQSHQSFYHTHIFDEYKRNPEGFSRKKCVYSFFKNISSSDAGTCYCAVATCEEIFSGNGTKLDIEGNCKTFLDKFMIILSGFLTTSDTFNINNQIFCQYRNTDYSSLKAYLPNHSIAQQLTCYVLGEGKHSLLLLMKVK